MVYNQADKDRYGEFQKELEGGWEYIQLKLEAIFQRDKNMGRVCGEW